MKSPFENTSCESCVYFQRMKVQKKQDTTIGNCIRNCPIPSNTDDKSAIGKFPIVISTMVCGEWWDGKAA